jgi:hypothetical protein
LLTKPLISVVILVLAVALVHSSYSGFEAFAEPRDPNWGVGGYCTQYTSIDAVVLNDRMICCWDETDILDPEGEKIVWCQDCDSGGNNCGPIELEHTSTGPIAPLEDGVLEQPPPPPTGPFVPPQGGVLQQPQTSPTPIPTPAPEDDQSDDGPGPVRGPLGGGVLQEPDDEPEDNGDNDEQEESSNEDRGSDTGPLN